MNALNTLLENIRYTFVIVVTNKNQNKDYLYYKVVMKIKSNRNNQCTATKMVFPLNKIVHIYLTVTLMNIQEFDIFHRTLFEKYL